MIKKALADSSYTGEVIMYHKDGREIYNVVGYLANSNTPAFVIWTSLFFGLAKPLAFSNFK